MPAHRLALNGRRARPALLAAAGAAFVAAALLCAAAAAGRVSAQDRQSPLTRAPDGHPLVLTFQEDFHSFAPGKVWRTTYGDGGDAGLGKRTLGSNGEQQVYVDPAFGAQIGAPGLNPFNRRNGVLEITAEPTPPALAGKVGGLRYTSGLITSQPSFSQRYGYFEVRARLPRGKGLWPAIWMLPADQTWPPEIDIMESIGNPGEVYLSTHSKVAPARSIKVSVPPEAFHTYAVAWDPQQIVWYVDGREATRQATPADMNKPMFLLLNLAVGGNWPGTPDASTSFPARMSIEYVRAYRFAQAGGR